MRIVLTGATGFLGNAVMKALLAGGNEVSVLVRPDSDLEKLQGLRKENIIEYTSLKSTAVIARLKSWQPKAMIHLAWKGVGGQARNEAVHFTENIPFTLDSVSLAHQAGCTQWIGMGSQAEYGVPNKRVAETEPCQPETAYGRAKLAAGIASLGLCSTLNMKGTWCRVFSVYGPGDHPGTFISYLLQSFREGKTPSLTACEQQWDFLYLTDAAAAICKLAVTESAGIYNIGKGETVALKEVAEQLRKAMAVQSEVAYGKKPYAPRQVMHLEADVTKLQTETGWKPLVELKEGLQKTILSLQKEYTNESI